MFQHTLERQLTCAATQQGDVRSLLRTRSDLAWGNVDEVALKVGFLLHPQCTDSAKA